MRQLIVIGMFGVMLMAAKCDEEGGGCDIIEDDEAEEGEPAGELVETSSPGKDGCGTSEV